MSTNKVPYLFIIGMKYMGSIFMNSNTMLLLAVNVTSNMLPFINYQTTLSIILHLVSKCCTIQSATNDKIIIFFHIYPLLKNFLNLLVDSKFITPDS